jgi:predicted nucleic acid-binding protein
MSMSPREAVFLDSSAILRYFTGDSAAKDVIEGAYKFVINSIVYSEVAFNLLKLLYMEKRKEYKFYDMKLSLSRLDHDILRGYGVLHSFLDELYSEGKLIFLPITMEIVREAGKIATEYGLLPNDSLIAATCKYYDIGTIATFDEDFKRIPWLRIIP